MGPIFVVHYIPIAADDGIIQLGDGVNIYPVYPGQLSFGEIVLIG